MRIDPMSRKTSIATYRLITENGLLSKRRSQVWKALYEYGPCTVNELYSSMKQEGSISSKNQQANLTPRLLELKEQGCAETLGDRICSITGNEVSVWRTTDTLPKKLPKSLGLAIAKQRKLVGKLTSKLRRESLKLKRMEEQEARRNQLSML